MPSHECRKLRPIMASEWGRVSSPQHFRAKIGADPAEIGEVRGAVRALADGSGFAERDNDIILALDELLANAQEHGRPPIEVNAWSDGRLVIEVTDSGGGFDYQEVLASHPPAVDLTRGRGLWIVRQLSDTLRVTREGERTRVRMELTPEPHIGA